jgi:hypothetical protein
MQTAWRERNPVARIKAAHDALEKNPDCAPAYILLAEEEAVTILDVEKIFKQALRAAEMNYRKSQQMQHQGSVMEALHSEFLSSNCIYFASLLYLFVYDTHHNFWKENCLHDVTMQFHFR